MSQSYTIAHQYRNGNLHIVLQGEFPQLAVWDLLNLIHERHTEHGRIFIDTKTMDGLYPLAGRTFARHFPVCGIAPSKLFFKGENGRHMAPTGSKVLITQAKRPCCRQKSCAGKGYLQQPVEQ